MKIKDGKFVSITDYARLRGVTTETLRHYDRIGLLKPAFVDPDSKVRYYSLTFADEKLGTIMELRQLDMSLMEIKDFLDGRNLRKSLEVLKKKQEILSDKINKLSGINSVLCERIENIERYLNSNYDFGHATIKRLLPRLAIISENYYDSSDEIPINLDSIIMEQYISDIAPLIGGERFALLIPTDGLKTGQARFCVALIVNALNTGKLNVSTIDGGLYACETRFGSPMDVMEDYKIIEEFCLENDYEITGDAVELLVIDMSITDIPEENVYELQVPITKK